MPFVSKAQERAAFSGALGPEMKAKAQEWARQTNQSSLPQHVKRAVNEHVNQIMKQSNANSKVR